MGRTRLWVVVWASWVVLLLSGCASSGATYESLSSALPTLKANEGRVFFYRSASVVGAALQPEIRLNNQVVGRSQPGGFFYVDTAPGRHLATSQTEVETRLEFDVEAGQTVYVTSSIGFGIVAGRVQLSLRPELLAVGELSSLRHTGSATPPPRTATLAPTLPPPGARPRREVTMADLEGLLPAPTAGGAR